MNRDAPAGRKTLLRASSGGTVLAIYAALLLAASVALPWWRMECHAPQYGARTLVIDVSLTHIDGDAKEIDTLGHYVGMQSLFSLAPVERAAAPYGLAAAVLAALLLPFLGAGWPRRIAAAVVIAVPIGFLLDMWLWQRYSVTHLDPTAALNMIQNRVRAQLFGSYKVAQFAVDASFQTGFWIVVIAAMNAIGFVVVEGRRSGERAPSGKGAVVTGLVALCLLALAPSAEAARLEVGSAAPYRTIGAAIEAASPGDEIFVHAGTYRERIEIGKPLILRGEPGAVVDAGGEGSVISVSRGPTEIRNLELRSGGDSLLTEDAGVKLKYAAGCVVEGNRIADTLFGILLNSSPRARIAGNHITGKDLIVPRRGDGIRLFDSGDSLVDDNVIERSRDLSIWQSNHVEVHRNVVRHSRYGLHFMYCNDNLFEDNVFEDNQVGAAIMYSRRLTLRRNRFAHSRGPSAVGVLIKVGDDVIAEDNRIIDNTTGVFLEGVPNAEGATCAIRRNVVGGNDVGVEMQPAVDDVLFTENAFVANRIQVKVRGYTDGHRNRWSAEGRGNYWSDYVGFDADGDGVGDAPYRVEQFFEDLTERWPEVGVLRMSPVTMALEMAARAFPIGQPRLTMVDEHPLVRPPASLRESSSTSPRPALAIAGLLAAALAIGAFHHARSDGDIGVGA